MAEIFDGPPEFVDLTVVDEVSLSGPSSPASSSIAVRRAGRSRVRCRLPRR
jgi:hypothetical protein